MKKLVVFMVIIIFSFTTTSFTAENIFFSTSGKYIEVQAVAGAVNPDFVKKLEEIYIMVSDSLGLKTKNIGLVIITYKTDKEVEIAYNNNKQLPHKAFFVAKENTIYVSLESITDRIMAHEMAHALVFKELNGSGTLIMHEILAKYAEYYIQKKLQSNK